MPVSRCTRTLTQLSIAGLFLLAPTEASFACSYNMPPEARIRDKFDAVVIATVIKAGYTAKQESDYHPWSATARVSSQVAKALGSTTFEFGRSGSTSACEDGQDPPKNGESWVLYLRRHEGRLLPYESYPLSWARVADERFHPTLPDEAPVGAKAWRLESWHLPNRSSWCHAFAIYSDVAAAKGSGWKAA